MQALEEFKVPATASLIDVGGGASRLVDHLVGRGWSDLTIVDIASSALEVAQARLGKDAGRICWETADVTAWRPDRAVFHFLVEPKQRMAYRHELEAGTIAGSLVIIASFALDGPERCSGLPVQRYDAAALSVELGPAFTLQRDWREEHTTPGGGRQSFQWCVFRRN